VSSGGTLTTLYSFGSTSIDGQAPAAGLIQGSDGNFYGTTSGGGAHLHGTVFKVSSGGALTTVYSFGSSSADGQGPTGLIQGADGNFYGTTSSGGANSVGTVFSMTPRAVFTTLHSFGSTSIDGRAPAAGLIQGSDGNFYGTASAGGAHTVIVNGPVGAGVIFKISPGGTLTTLYNFDTISTDGQTPLAALIQASDGNFYGTTSSGGSGGSGTIFKITPAGTLTTLYSFYRQAALSPYCLGFRGCPEPPEPLGMIQGTDGNFYGVTWGGGDQGRGTAFSMTPGGTLTTLYSFCADGFLCYDGSSPNGIIQGFDGALYGTTFTGGFSNIGTLFRLQPTAPYTCTNTVPPVITSVDSASAYGNYPYFASGSWLEIKGTNLADPADPRLTATVNPGQWTSGDFNSVDAPTSLDGISVSVNGKAAYVWYLSTGQLNVQAPEDTAGGNVAITATNCKATSSTFMFARRTYAPGLLAPTSFTADGTPYMVATFASDGAYVLNTSTGAALGLKSRPAKPGDLIIAYGIGFGDVTPSILPGVIVAQSNTLINPITLSFGSTPAVLSYSGLAGGFVGLYEFYITVPSTLVNGDYQIIVTYASAPVPQTMYLTVHN
jgi:uncharacterized protein (TIGR03437 family)